MVRSIEIENLEVDVAPCGASDAVTGPNCVVIIVVIAIFVYYDL